METITIKDIAKACNVSFSTVSKALKGSSEISDATIRFVTETAKKMGYQPNRAAQTLRTNKTFDIGVIFEDKTGSGLQHQYFAEIFSSMNTVANRSGYNITFLNSEAENKRTYLEQAVYRGFDGIVVVSSFDFECDEMTDLFKSSVPTSVLDFESPLTKSSVMSDNYNGTKTLVEHAISKGHRRIAFITGDLTDVTEKRLKAYHDVLAANGIEANPDYLKKAQYHNIKLSEKATAELLALPAPPSCILFPDDFACIGGYNALKPLHFEAGKDVSFIGYDGILLASLLTPSITTYAQNAKEIGKKLIENLVVQIEKKETKLETDFITGSLVEGDSVAVLA